MIHSCLQRPNVTYKFSDTADVDVLIEASLEFGGDFATPGEVSVQLDSSTSFVECSARGGYPTPEIKARLLNEDGELVRDLEEMPDLTEMVETESGITEVLTKKFLLVPSMDDCGLHVQCEVDQGEGVLQKQESRQLLIVYQPQPVVLKTPFQYTV